VGAPKIATGAAGNVIGGGDWAKDRLIPDLVEAFMQGTTPLIRSPHAVRPWQHVLEPLAGYLTLCEALWAGGADEGWNFGPNPDDAKPVSLDRRPPGAAFGAARRIGPWTITPVILMKRLI